MGGVRVDADSQMSRVPGLFAAGECAAGLHGANRLGGNSLSDLLVFGCLAGHGAAEYIQKEQPDPKIDEEQVLSAIRQATDILNREEGNNPYLIHDDLREQMQKYVGIIRVKEEIAQGIEEIARLRRETETVKASGTSQYNAGWHTALDLRNLLISAEAVARAGHLREESRGAHTRLDFEGEREDWGKKNIIIRRGKTGEMEVEAVDRPEMPDELAAVANAKIEDLEKEAAANV